MILLGQKVAIIVDPESDTTPGGILLTTTTRTGTGEIAVVGVGVKQSQLIAGSRVTFPTVHNSAGNQHTIEGREFLVLHEDLILAILDKPGA